MGQATAKPAARPPPFVARRRRVLTLAVTLGALFGLTIAPLAAQATTSDRAGTATVRGRVSSFATERPIDGARVAIPGTGLETTTDPDGRFVLSGVPAGVRRLRVSFEDRVSDRLEMVVRADRENEIEILVDVDVLPVPELHVSIEPPLSGKLAGFYERRERGTGMFMTREEIEEHDPSRTSDLFRALPGIRVSRFGPGTSSVEIARGAIPCPIEYFLDGMRVEGFEVDAVSPGTIDAIEVYRGPAEVPPQFRRRLSCAAIVIWTRDPAP